MLLELVSIHEYNIFPLIVISLQTEIFSSLIRLWFPNLFIQFWSGFGSDERKTFG